MDVIIYAYPNIDLCVDERPNVLEWHIYALVNYAIVDSDNGLSPVRRETIFRSNDGVLLVDPWEQAPVKFESKYMCEDFRWKNVFKMPSEKLRSFCRGLNVHGRRHQCGAKRCYLCCASEQLVEQ